MCYIDRREVMKINIFVTAVGGDIACATLRCIYQSYDYNLLMGCDIHEYVQGRMYVNDFILAPKYSDEKVYFEFIKEMCLKHGITHFLPMTEAEIIIADNNRDFFTENNIHLMINNPNIIDIATSKFKTAKYLSENGVKTPETYYLEEYKDQLVFPFIMKANQSCGSKQIRVISNKAEFIDASTIIESPVIQRYIGSSDEEYTMGVFSDGNTTKSIVFKRKLGFGGMSVYVETVKDKALEHIADKISQILELRGSINVQLRKDGSDYSVFEINPRISSTVGFRNQLGFKDVIWWLDLLNKKNIEYGHGVEGGIIGIKTLDELLFVKGSID